jgi:hypothetical protein
MDGSQCVKGRRISRSCEKSRLEEEVWALAYEQVWPLLRRALKQSEAEPKADAELAASASTSLLRSA